MTILTGNLLPAASSPPYLFFAVNKNALKENRTAAIIDQHVLLLTQNVESTRRLSLKNKALSFPVLD